MPRGANTAEVGEENKRKVYDFLVEFVAKNGYSPTIRTVAEGVGFSSPSPAYRHLEQLVRDRLLLKTPRGYMPCQ